MAPPGDRDFVAEGLTLNIKPLMIQPAPPPKPLDLVFEATTDGERYSLTTTVVLPNFRGVHGLDGVIAVGYRLGGNIPVYGGGLQYPWVWEVDPRLSIVAKASLTFLVEQGDSLDSGRLRLGGQVGIRF